MPRVCPRCGALQPEGPQCANCGFKFEQPVRTAQDTQVTASQLRDYALLIVGLALIVMLAFAAIVISCVLIAR